MYARGHKGEKERRLCVLSILGVSSTALERTYPKPRENVSLPNKSLSSFPFPLSPFHFFPYIFGSFRKSS